jgi:hypothetical protein
MEELMLKERRMAAEQIATALWDAESAVDVALTKTATFTGAIPALRKQAGASALIGQEAMERASQAVMALAEARRALVEAHKELTLAKEQVGLGAITMEEVGGGKGYPTASGATAARGRALRAVSAA